MSLSEANVTKVVPLGRGLDPNNAMTVTSLVATTDSTTCIVLRPDATDAPWIIVVAAVLMVATVNDGCSIVNVGHVAVAQSWLQIPIHLIVQY